MRREYAEGKEAEGLAGAVADAKGSAAGCDVERE
jgi:hypothetical protein